MRGEGIALTCGVAKWATAVVLDDGGVVSMGGRNCGERGRKKE